MHRQESVQTDMNSLQEVSSGKAMKQEGMEEKLEQNNNNNNNNSSSSSTDVLNLSVWLICATSDLGQLESFRQLLDPLLPPAGQPPNIWTVAEPFIQEVFPPGCKYCDTKYFLHACFCSKRCVISITDDFF